MEEFRTANARLEQFLFAHRIKFIRQQKNDDLLTEWVYKRSPELEKIIAEFREIWNMVV